MKKTLVAFAVVIALLSAGIVSAAEQIVLHQWDWHSQPHTSKAMDDLIKAFTEKYPHIRIERTYYSFGDIRQQLLVGSIAGNSPDIIIIDNPDHQAMAVAGVLADIDYIQSGDRPISSLKARCLPPFGKAATTDCRRTATPLPCSTTRKCSQQPVSKRLPRLGKSCMKWRRS